MSINYILVFIYDLFYLTHRQIILFGNAFMRHSFNEFVNEYAAIAISHPAFYPLVYYFDKF